MSLPLTSVVVASFITAQARLLLYSHMEKLGNRMLYCDTDSTVLIFTGEKDEYVPPMSTFLGEINNELKNLVQNAYIKAFVSSGPKSYAFKGVDSAMGEEFEVCEMKGVTLNNENSQKVNFEGIKKMLNAYFENSEPGEQNICLDFRAIRRTLTHDVITKDE